MWETKSSTSSFERLLEEGRPKDALALWRGQPLSDVAYSRFARAETARLEELRVSALEERIEQDLAAGRHTTVVGELEALVHEHPLRERLRGQLMLALYRSGRQAEALEAYQEGRRLLSEELGLEPSRRLRELQQAILNQDPALDASVTAHRPETTEEARRAGDEPARELRKTISVLHVHAWMSSANGGPLDPEALRLLAESFAGLVEQAAERHGGSVETCTGDAATAVFGLPVAHEDDARRAVRAALDVRAGVHDQLPRDARIEVRMAIATGEVIAGGGRTIGEPLSAAARLAMSAESGTYCSTARHIACCATSLRSRKETVGSHCSTFASSLSRTAPRRWSGASASCGGYATFSNRRSEMERVSCSRSSARPASGVTARRRTPPRHRGLRRCHARALPPLRRGHHLLARSGSSQGAGKARRRRFPRDGQGEARQRLGDEQDAELVAQRVAEMIGLAEVALGAEEGFAAVQTLFETLARVEPIVVVFDDIHWG